MAKRRRRARRGTGSVIAVRQLSGSGLGKVSRPGSAMASVVPALIGGLSAGGSLLLIEHMGKPQAGQVPSETMVRLAENSEYAALGMGVLGAGAMYLLFGTPAFLSALAAAGAVGGTVIGLKSLQKTESTAVTDPSTGPTVNTSGLGGRFRYRMRGTGAIVAQNAIPGSGYGGMGVGAIVMEPTRLRGGLGDPRGETVSLGNVNPTAFGTPGFNV